MAELAEAKEPKIRIGHYLLGQTLGHGSFGKVKIAEHEITGHKVAVKILNRQKISGNKHVDQKIKREIRILKLLRHPHIIQLYEVIETTTDIFMVMEYVSGGELFDYIVKKGRLKQLDARMFFQQIICGVEHIHHYRVVHRDLKPENLLLDENHEVRIADFGLSNLVSDGEFLRTSCGSPNYAAPEVISGKLYAGPEVDVWSCGVILYALVCGRLPFDEDSIPALFKRIKEGSYSVPHHLSASCKDLLSRMLVVDPVQRITIPQIREHEFFKTELPKYLSVPPSCMSAQEAKIDESLLQIICKRLDVSMDIALRAIQSGTRNDIYVAYYILLDAKARQMPFAIPNEIPSSPAQVPDLKSAPILEQLLTRYNEKQARESYNEPMPVSFAAVQSFVGSAMSSFDHSLQYSAPSTLQPLLFFDKNEGHPEQECKSVHENWRLGLFTELASNAAIQQIYRVLRQMRMVWKVLSPYHLRCKHPEQPENGHIGIQLYRMHDRHDKGYLVDFVIMNDVAFPAIDVVHELFNRVNRSIGA